MMSALEDEHLVENIQLQFKGRQKNPRRSKLLGSGFQANAICSLDNENSAF